MTRGVADPRGLAFDQNEGLLFVNSGADRVLALDAKGHVVRDTGPIAGLNPGGGNFAPDGRLVVGMRTAKSITSARPFRPCSSRHRFLHMPARLLRSRRGRS
jgi:hypothetical protein